MKRSANTTTQPIPRPADPQPADHLRDPALAQALFAVWSGDPAVVIDSPPGAGKTHLITRLAHQLSTRAGMTIAIAAQTRAQAIDVANRTAATGAQVTYLMGTQNERPATLSAEVGHATGTTSAPKSSVLVATSARWLWMPFNRVIHFDVLLIDEAYQLTFADLGALGSLADQFVLVGDPGQIAPVITGSPRRWERWDSGPHTPAPQALIAAHGDNITRIRLPHTWRLGAATTALLAPLYPTLPFDSARPPRHISTNGQPLPEYTATGLTITAGTADPNLITTIREQVHNLLADGTITTPTGTRAITAGDIAVIAPHVEQTALAAAALANHPDLFIGTINQAQGLQREAVIAVHPLLGHEVDEKFALDLGRLCVALSRHRSHVSVLFDHRTPAQLTQALTDHPATTPLSVHLEILQALTDPPEA